MGYKTYLSHRRPRKVHSIRRPLRRPEYYMGEDVRVEGVVKTKEILDGIVEFVKLK